MDRDLEDDIRADAEIMTKILDNTYAQNVYAALCNMRWQLQEVWPVLQDEYWICSWRSAGGIVAELQGRGDYMDWYCSGIHSVDFVTEKTTNYREGYVKEGTVTDEIRADFARIGWHPSEWPND